MKKILLPTDFSETANRAAEYAIELLQEEKAEFILLNAYEMPHAGSSMLVSLTDLLREESVKGLEEQIANLKSKYESSNRFFRSISEYGSLVSVLERYLKNESVDLIVMGTLGASGVRDILIGSNASAVIRNIHHPVLSIPAMPEFKKPDNVAMAVDHQGIKDPEVLKPLKEIVHRFGSKLNLVTICKNDQEVQSASDTAETLIKQHFEGLPVQVHTLRNNDPGEGLRDYMENNATDLMVMLPRDLGFFERLFHRSVTRHMATHLQVPMLSLHEL